MTEIPLPSGSVLGFQLADMKEGRALYRAWSAELEKVDVQGDDDFNLNFIKNMMCRFADSDRVEAAVLACMRRCTLNGERIIYPDTFEDLRAREDYVDACAMVMRENLRPFAKSLVTQFRTIFRGIIELRGLSTLAREKKAAEEKAGNGAGAAAPAATEGAPATPLN